MIKNIVDELAEDTDRTLPQTFWPGGGVKSTRSLPSASGTRR